MDTKTLCSAFGSVVCGCDAKERPGDACRDSKKFAKTHAPKTTKNGKVGKSQKRKKSIFSDTSDQKVPKLEGDIFMTWAIYKTKGSFKQTKLTPKKNF